MCLLEKMYVQDVLRDKHQSLDVCLQLRWNG